LYIRVDHGDYKYDLPDKFHPAAFWVSDTHLKKPYKKIKRQIGHYDYLFCCQRQAAIRHDAYWIPHAFDNELVKPLGLSKIYDIGFVGTDGKKSLRKTLLARLKERYPDSFLDKARYDKMAEVYSQSRIGFNYSIQNDINMRMFEVIGANCLLLTNEIKNNGFEEIFQDRVNCVVYRTPEELFELADYYLGHDREREEIARAGYELSKQHTYQSRLNGMFKIMGIAL